MAALAPEAQRGLAATAPSATELHRNSRRETTLMKTPPPNVSLPKVDDGDTARLLPDEDFGASYVGAGARNNTAD
jgi:hypothetical protein